MISMSSPFKSPLPPSEIRVKLHSGGSGWLIIEPFLECAILKLNVLGIVCNTGVSPKYDQQDLMLELGVAGGAGQGFPG